MVPRLRFKREYASLVPGWALSPLLLVMVPRSYIYEFISLWNNCRNAGFWPSMHVIARVSVLSQLFGVLTNIKFELFLLFFFLTLAEHEIGMEAKAMRNARKCWIYFVGTHIRYRLVRCNAAELDLVDAFIPPLSWIVDKLRTMYIWFAVYSVCHSLLFFFQKLDWKCVNRSRRHKPTHNRAHIGAFLNNKFSHTAFDERFGSVSRSKKKKKENEFEFNPKPTWSDDCECADCMSVRRLFGFFIDAIWINLFSSIKVDRRI